ncbi:beta strand repeat-containing protein [Streptosporangium oxazolinicum]
MGRGLFGTALSGLLACAVGLAPMMYTSSATALGEGDRPSFVISCGPSGTGPTLRLTRETRFEGDRAIVTVHVANTGDTDAEGASFAEDLSAAPDSETVSDTRATTGTLTYDEPLLRWTGDLAAGDSAEVRYAVRMAGERMFIPTVNARAGRTCQETAAHPELAEAPGGEADTPPGAPDDEGDMSADTPKGTPAFETDTPADAPAGTTADEPAGDQHGPSGTPADPTSKTARSATSQRGSPTDAMTETRPARSGARSGARRAPIAFSNRYTNNYRGSVTRAANAVVTCYPPAVTDCATRQNGSGNNNVAATFIDVDSDATTFNSSTADLTLSAGAQVAYARLYWGGRGQTTTDTPGLPAGNRLAPSIDLRGRVLIKAPGDSAYRTITATAADIGDTPDNVTATGIVYGASADVTSLVASAGAGTYAVGNVQAARGFDSLGAFGGWSLVVAYRDPALPLRNISVFDGFLQQQNGAADTTINLSGFRTPAVGSVNVQLGEIAYDGDNAIVGDSLSIKTTNGPLTVLSDALHPANNFFNSTIANLGTQVTNRNPTYTNLLGYDSNIIDASSAFRNNDTSAQFTFSTVGDAYWPQAFFTQIDLHQANLQMTKTAQVIGGGDPQPGSVVEYTITTTNVGDDTAIGVLLFDPLPPNTVYVPGTISVASGPNAGSKTDPPGDDQGQFVGNQVSAQLGTGANASSGGTLTPGQSTSVRFRVTLGPNSPGTTVTDTATITYASADTPTQQGTATASASTAVPVLVPSVALLKTASPTTITAAGRTITYSYLITNTGRTALTGVNAVDTAFSGSGTRPVITCPVTTLAPQASTTCTSTYVTTQADVDAGSIVNTAVASGTPPTGAAVSSAPSTATVTATRTSSLALLKTASPTTVTAAGRTVTYSYAIVNTGNTTLTGVGVVDTVFSGSGTRPVITCPVTTLAPQASTTCTSTYVTTQADVDAGSIVNTAVASGTPPTGAAVSSAPSTATVTATRTSSLALLKTASPTTVTAAGRTITYSYVVTNTGNATLTGVGVVDTAFSGSGTRPVITCPVTTLAPQASTTCTSTYVTTQADVNAGSIVNTAVASGTPPTGAAVSSAPSTATVTATRTPSLALLKTASPTTVTAAGQTVTYSYAITNTGNTTLTGVGVVDTAFSGSGTRAVITCPVTTLAPQQSTTCTGTYVVTQADVDAGSIVNTATASGTPPTGPAVSSAPSTATVTATRTPSLALLKTASPSTVAAAGLTVTYSFLVTNTGNATLTGIGVADTAFSGSGTPPVITCPVTTLAPRASTTCTGTYVTTQADVDAGSVVNTAVASGTPPTGPAITSAPSTATLTAVEAPGLALLKTAVPSTVTAAGQTVTYSFLVTNTGNTTLTGVSATDTAFSGSGTPPVITCPVTTLAPRASTTCTGTYVITQADIDAGSVVNTATASGTPPTGPAVTSAPSTATVTATPAPGLALLKTASPSTVAAAGRTVTYSFLVTNTGNTTLTGVGATDTVFSGSGAPPVITCPVTTLAPQGSTTCTGTYVTTQADIDAGSIVNTATASGTPPTGPAITSAPSTVTIAVVSAPSLALLKTASPSTVAAAGRTVTYSFLVTNTGNATLTGVGAVDTAFSGSGAPPVITCPVTTLAPQGSTTCTGTYVTTQADIDAGSVVNTAVASGTPPTGAAVSSAPSTATVTATPAPSLALLKTASPSTVAAAGQTVTYSYLVTNTGNTTLTGVSAVDTAFSGSGTPAVVTCPVTTLEPQQSTTCTGAYVVTQADIDAGSIVNTAIASGTPPTGPAVSSAPSTVTIAVVSAPSLALLKIAVPATVTTAGQTVTYSYLVTNTGNTTLTGVSAVDTAFSGSGTPAVVTCPVTTLEPQQSTTCTGTYVTTQADIDAGSIVNTAVASGTPPTGPAVTSAPSTATVTAASAPSLALLKTASPSVVTAAGRTVTYSYVVTNTGNATLTGVGVVDTAFSGSGAPPVVTCPVTTLAPQGSTTCTGTYVTTQADIDAGSVVNTAVASGTPPTGPAVSSAPSTATVTVASAPSLALLKTAVPATVTAAEQEVTYSFLVTNTGNTTLTGVSVIDTTFSGSGTPPVITCPVTTLEPQDSTTCTGTYVVTQADIDTGSIVNTAVASGSPPTGPAVSSAPSTATVATTPAPSVALLKTAVPATVTTAGQTVTYSYLVTNTGNTTLTGISAADTAFSGSGTPAVITCPVTTLAPQDSTTCTGTYVTTQADVDAGSIVNTAVASGTPPTGPAVSSAPSTATVAAASAPGLALLKTVVPATVTAAGQTVTYSYLVTNTGNTTLTGVGVVDTAFSGSGAPPVITCPVTTLAPQASTTCTGTYVVTQADIDAGSIVDTAVASGTPPTGPAVSSAPSTATVTAVSAPSLALLKTASPNVVTAAGRTVIYSYLVTNTGNTTLTGVSAADTAFSGSGTPAVVTCPVTTLEPQDSTTCTGTYVSTQADIDAGSVVNTAVASGTPPTGPAVSSAPSTVTITAVSAPSLALLKTASPSTVTAAGQTVTYSYVITNTGNATLTGISATDTAFSGSGTPPVVTCPVTTLEPQESTTCTGTYVVTQADIDADALVNTAVASGTPPTGPAVTSAPSTATVATTLAPSVALLKTASPNVVTAAGRTVIYSYLVTNTGNTTLTGVSAADTAFSGSGTPAVITCPVTTLVPQASTTCTGTYVSTQADVDAGSIVNTAVASGTPPTGPAVTSAPSTVTITAVSAPSLALLKTASPNTVTAAGQTVTYSYLVTNTGNTTLTGVSAADTAFSGSGTPAVVTCPVTTLEPQDSTTCTGTYVVTQADIDAGSVVNTATASGTPPTGAAVSSAPSTATVTAVSAPSVALLKTASPNVVTAAGRTVIYSYLVTNTGNTTLTGVSAADTAFSGSGTPAVITCPVTTLEPQESTTCTGTYVSTQADVDAGSIVNTAVASGTPPTGPAVSSAPSTVTVTAVSAPSLALLKTAVPAAVTAAGQTVTYSYLVTNTGNTTLTGVSAADTAFSGSGTPAVVTCPVTTLEPQESTTCTGTYVVTQADIDAGSVVNTAVASGTPPTGPAVTSAPSTATVTAASAPSLALLKTASPSTVTAAGHTVTYSYLVTNTGNTTLTGVSAADTAFSGSGTPAVVTCPVTTLEPQDSTTCTGTYVVTQADIDAGSVVNTAVASGTPPTGPVVTSAPSTATVTAVPVPSLALLKTASPSTVTAEGQTVTYSYLVTNTGNTTLTGVDAADTAFSGSGTPAVVTCPVTTLEPQDSTTCTGTYVVTQADIDAGSIVNTATASGTPPTGPAVTSAPSTATVTAVSTPSLALLKTAVPVTVTAAGQEVTYSYLVTNTGNTTLTGISAADTAFSGSGTPAVITCPVTTLEPQDSTTCTGTYVVTQDDVDAGSIVNTAVASGTPPTGPAVTSAPSTATITATPAPSLALLKTASPSTVAAAGRTITYSYAIVNTGNTTLTGIDTTDTAFSGSGTPPVVTCPVTTLEPQESTTCTGTYVSTQADIDAGSIVNTAVASGTPPTGPAVTSAPSTATITATPAPSLALLKTAFPSAMTTAGQTITYSYAIVNTGNTTLTGISATDTAFSGSGTPPVITCPVTTLEPQESTTCTGTYVVTQADIDADTIVNTATASGTPPTGPAVTSAPSTVTITGDPAPGLTLLKTAAPSTVEAAGRTVTYSYLVVNTGNATLTGVGVVDTAFSGSGTPPVVTCPVTTLAPQGSTTCTGTYVTTQADIDAGSIVNTAVASGTPPVGPAVSSAPSTATIVVTSAPSVALLKTASPSTVAAAGRTVTYSFLVTNTGNATLTGVGAVDTAFSGSGTPPVITCPVTTLAPQASTTCTGTYVTTQADIDAGSIVNTATASGTPPTGPAVTSAPSTVTITVVPAPSVALLKTASLSTVTAAGQTVTYSFLVTNTGNATLTGVSAIDTAFSGSGTPPVITCPVTTLAPQASTTCTGTYVVTQADIDAGSVVNTAVASGTPPTGPAVSSAPSTATVTAVSAPSLALLKTAVPATVTAAGQTVTYSYLVTNTGNATLTGVSATDTAFSGSGAPPVVTCPVTTLAPQASTTCTGTYVTTQADVDAGSVVNTATASGTPPAGPAVTSAPSTATVTVVSAPSVALLKTASPSTVTAAGQTVTYSYLVTNTGNATLTGISATDTAFSGSGTPAVVTCPVTTLAPQASTTCTGTYVVTQADIDAGSVVNTATASGTPPTGPAVTSAPSTATITATSTPSLALLKTASPSTVAAAGRTVTYSYLVTNTGNATLTGVGVVDTAFSGSGTPPVVTCPVTTLAPQASTTCTGTYVTTQADIDAGSVVNTAVASGTPPTGPAVTSAPSTVTIAVVPAPGVALLKTASPSTVTAAGQTVTYSYLVTNTGNTTLTGVSATDTAFSGSGVPPVITCPVTTLAPQASTTCTGTYVTTQADIDAGSVVNAAAASGTPPTGPAVTSASSTATITAIPAPSLALLKTASPSTVAAAGRTVTYSFLVTNTGNATLTGVSAVDTAFSGSGTPPVVTCPVTTLAPQASTTCTGTYVTTQADVDAGSVVNTAVASGTPPTGPAVTSAPSTVTIAAVPAPSLALLKTAVPVAVTAAGQTVTYSFLVTNTGNTTLTGVSATDTAFSGSGAPPVVTCPVTTLEPQESTTCTGTYVVTQVDIDAGSVVNTATASGTPPTGPAVTSASSTSTITAIPAPSLALLKTASPSTVAAAGRTVTYSYLVTNTGNTTLTGVSAVDTAFSGSGAPPVVTCPVTTLEPQQSTTCTGTYVTTQADIDADTIVNTAVASGTPPTGPAVSSASSTSTIAVTLAPSLALLKTASPSTVTAAGQTVTYSYLVTNTGNTTLTGISAADTAFSGSGTPAVVTCPVTTLEPQDSTTCTGTYVTTQADIDAGSVVNTATASGTPPVGPAVSSAPSTATVTAASAPSVALLKTAAPSTVTAAGQTVTYSFLVTNTGNATLTGVSAVDTAFSGSGAPPVITCPVTTLEPQESTTCTGTYVVTQADIDADTIVNTAVASGTPPTGPAVTSAPSTSTIAVTLAPGVALLKTAAPSVVTTAGQTVTYSYLVTNTGNTTLTGVSATDTAFSGSGTPPVITCPVTTLAPQQSTTCTGTYVTTQADIDAGSVANTATASGTPPTGPAVTSAPSTSTITATPAPSLALLKTASPSTVAAAGRTVTYSFLVTNTGTTTLTGVSATDTAFSGSGTPPVITCPVTTLEPQQSTTCTGTYVTTQADIDAGSVANTATASGTPPTGPAVTSASSTSTITVVSAPSLALLKTASPSTVTAAGQAVTYSYVITNTGNATLTGVSATDTAFSGSGTPPVITCPVTTLEPQQSTTCTGTYVVTQADIDADTIVNTAVASGTPPTGPAVTSAPSTSTIAVTLAPSLALLKTASPSTVAAAGQTVTYSYLVTNTGNATLTGVSAVDTAFSGSGTPPVITCPVTTLTPQASTTCTGTYVITQADIDAGSVVNTAVASGTPPTGPAVTSAPSTATIAVTLAPGVALLKTALPATVTTVGQTVTYSYLVTNTGNTTLTGVNATDTAFSGSGTPPVISCPAATLAPQVSTTCTGTYVVTQADIDADTIVNTATASGTPPTGPAVTSAPSTATITVTLAPGLALLKTASPNVVTAAGRTVIYSYLVTNTGNTTLTGVSAVDTAFSGSGTPPVVTCPVTTLAPQVSTTCTGTYVSTQADVDAGSIVNTATASGTPPTGPAVTSAPSTATVTAASTPSLALLKTASPSTVTAAGQTVTYSYVITNTGNATLTGVNATDTAFSGSGTPPVITCPVTILEPQASTTCTGTYVVTQADIDADTIVNTATASGTPPTGPAVTSAPSTATVAVTLAPGLALLKTASPSTVAAAGETVTYSYLVTNTGNATLTGISATDTAFSGSGVPPVITCPVTTLAPQASTTCTGTYVVTQADIDADTIVNTATASGTPPTGPAVTSAPSTSTIAVTLAPGLAVLKTALPAAVTEAGQTVTYSYVVTNTGNTTLTGVSAVDTAFSGSGTPPVVTCPVTTLAPQASTTCTGTYVVTQADIDADTIVNTATASGTPPTGPAVTSAPSTATVTAASAPGLAVLKTASPSTVAAAGRTVTYSYLVVNTGNVTLTGVSAVDTAFSGSGTPPVITCPVTTLEPQASTTCTGTYVVTQADIDAGQVVNTATASGTPPTGPAITSAPSTATVAVTLAPGLALLKTASPSTVAAAGRTVTYSYLVVNTGNASLTTVSVTDTAFSGSGTPPVITCPVTTLEPQASTTCTSTYVVTQADIDAGSIVNTAVASGAPPTGPVVTSAPSTATVTAVPALGLTVLKTASPSTVAAAGRTVTYSYLVVNTANVTLTGVSAVDTAFSGSGAPPVVTCPVTTLEPQDSTTCTGTYVTTQADIDAGSIVNTAVASGTPPAGPAVTSAPSTSTIAVVSAPSLALLKTASPSTVAASGRTVTYSYALVNTGNATLTGISATDTAFSGSGTPPVVTCPVTTLEPQASTTCTGTYVVTQADIDAGQVVNTATASGTPPTGPAVTSAPSTATVTAVLDPGVVLLKTAAPSSVTDAGQTVTYSYTITNTGNVRLTGVSAVDTAFSGSGTPPVVTCPVTTLEPQELTTCTGAYVVTQADIDAGSIVNTATASGTPPTGPVVTSAASTATVTAGVIPTLVLLKTADPSAVTAVGQTVTYSQLVTNSGNVTMTGISVVDTAFSGAGTPPVITCPVTALAPQDSTTCTGTYVTTQADIDAGQIVNTAVASGTPPTGPVVMSAASTATVTAALDPGLTLVKSAAPSTVSAVGQTVTYSYLVTNTGIETLTGVNATDTVFSGSGAPPVVTCPVTALAPQASTTCTGAYVVTQADLDAGSIVNTAVASGTPPTGPVITSAASTATVTAARTPRLTLVKTATPRRVTVPGEPVTYSYLITNIGNVTVRDISVRDTSQGSGTPEVITCPVTTLVPQEATTCTGRYVVTRADIDAGAIVNSATASGSTLVGGSTTSNVSVASVVTADPVGPRAGNAGKGGRDKAAIHNTSSTHNKIKITSKRWHRSHDRHRGGRLRAHSKWVGRAGAETPSRRRSEFRGSAGQDGRWRSRR